MSGMLLAPPKWHPVGPFPRSCSEPKVELFPQIFCQLCATTSAAAIGRLDVGIKQSLEEKWRNGGRGGVPLAHSRRSSTQAKFCRETGHTPFHLLAFAMDLFT